MRTTIALLGFGLGLLVVSAGLQTVRTWTAARTILQGQSCVYSENATFDGPVVINRDGDRVRIESAGAVFAGAVADGRFVASRTHDFLYSDGCVWRASESLSGSLDSGRLDAIHDYVESVRAGRDCESACRIVAGVHAQAR